jgi:glycosyltransferase involved in cell wall biosynthesis
MAKTGIDVVELPGRFPIADERARASAGAALARLPDRSLVVIDGLALPAFDRAAEAHRSRLRIIGFVHHPLAVETGLTDPDRDRLAAIESRVWSMLSGIVCPSRESAEAVARVGVSGTRIEVAPPGTDPPAALGISRVPRARLASGPDDPVRLLAVGTVIARKGHLLLVDALSELQALNWHLDCIGSLERSPETVALLRDRILERGLGARVSLHGEVSESARDAAYEQAEVFALPSFHEGYGMVFAEAMAWGLPIVATTGGAIPETVPAQVGRLVAPGDRPALVSALAELIGDSDLRARMSSAARSAAQALPDWPAASARWIDAVERLAQ